MGNSKWDSIVSEAESKVFIFKWNGKHSRYTLAHHISSHRSSQNGMVRAKDNIGYHPPSEYTRVQRLIKSIKYTDIWIVSYITTILGDNIKRGNFEQAADYFLLADPMHKNYTSDNEHRISAVNDEGSENNNKASGYKVFKTVDKGTSVVELRYNAFKEYNKLPEDQREQL